MSWIYAEAHAVAWGGYLVTLDNSEEELWVKDTFGRLEHFYIGFNDIAEEDNWVWSSGAPVTYTNWDQGEPNNCCFCTEYPGCEDAAVMNWQADVGSGSFGDYWNDVPPDGGQRGIVERVDPPLSTVYLPLVLRGFPPVPAAPVLNAIENSDEDGNYTVSWNASANATGYLLQEDDNAAFSSPETRYSGPSTSWNATGKAAGTYYYRVQASNTWGASGWSNVASVIAQPPGGCSTIPTLLNPTNGSSLNTIAPLYRWDNGNNPSATTLRLQVAKDSGFTHVPGDLWSSTPHSGVREFRFDENLDPATTYYWRAWLVCGDTQGPYSAVWSFTTGSGGTILSAPALVAPPNGSTVPTTTVTFQWSSVSGAVEYLVHWRTLDQAGHDYSWLNDTQMTNSWLSANTTYEWWVSARNDYAVGADSEKWQVTTSAGSSSLSSRDLGHNVVVGDGSTSIVSEERNNR